MAMLTRLLTALPALERYARARTKCGTAQLLYCKELVVACGWVAAAAADRPVLLLCPDPSAAAVADGLGCAGAVSAGRDRCAVRTCSRS